MRTSSNNQILLTFDKRKLHVNHWYLLALIICERLSTSLIILRLTNVTQWCRTALIELRLIRFLNGSFRIRVIHFWLYLIVLSIVFPLLDCFPMTLFALATLALCTAVEWPYLWIHVIRGLPHLEKLLSKTLYVVYPKVFLILIRPWRILRWRKNRWVYRILLVNINLDDFNFSVLLHFLFFLYHSLNTLNIIKFYRIQFY